jgi:hypothetical protein
MMLGQPQPIQICACNSLFWCPAQLVQAELNLNQKYAVDVVNLTIVPDPTGATDGFSRDDSFMNLVMMKGRLHNRQ